MKISELKGIGEKTEQLFNRLSVYAVEDLIGFYPRAYEVFDNPVNVKDITEPGTYAVYAKVTGEYEFNNRGKYKIFSAVVKDKMNNDIKMIWYNMPYIKSRLQRGTGYIFRGRAAFRGGLLFMEQPVIFSIDEYSAKLDSMQPVYSLTAGLTNNTVIKAVRQAFEYRNDIKEYLPEKIVNDIGLTDINSALYGMHFPKNREDLEKSRERIVFDEFFLFTAGVRSMKSSGIMQNNGHVVTEAAVIKDVKENLGYSLTNAQLKVYDEIKKDMAGKSCMNRLVQGDVGSGKTILAFMSIINTIYSGFQAVLMVPTEVLAKQHYEAFVKIIEKNGINAECVLLTGSLKASEKKKAKEKAADGSAGVIIGTHAVITESVIYHNLGLVITDEQHRFGVRQRENLSSKGNNPHILVMSATPIPRSLAIILYGDLDISVLYEKPADRLPVKNCIVDSSYRSNAYRFIEKEWKKGNQAYVICAMTEKSDNEELENVVDYSKKLRKELPAECVVEYLHGKMKPSEKNEIMERFVRGEINVLVSTTVIEVGINVPSATVIMVENAERFGLAGLHQLRGRVGRGDRQSYCILVSDSRNKTTLERLKILKDSNDGFYISEQDLKLRGPGDMLGVRQSGGFGFKVADIYADSGILKKASEKSAELIADDPELKKPENNALRLNISEYLNNNYNRINL